MQDDRDSGRGAAVNSNSPGRVVAETQQPDSGAAPASAAEADCACPPSQQSSGPWKDEPGSKLDDYYLLQRIGEGGFGVVYMAEQREPVRRKVALKLIKPGMDTKAVIARFEAERQALAMMDHPNIARVLHAGTTPHGRPYFVMELVRGVPITAYCDTENLTTRQRLKLFCDVCQAVQHAHQKGIIHRDLKPSNVMVTLHDSVPVPKVIDFGIAKATNAELTQRTLFTEFRQFIGTPEYMSPEQAEMSGLDIDTRTDIYSLGVLFYELLTGTTPFQGDRLRSVSLDEIQRIIREEEPQRPSTRLSSLMTPAPAVRRGKTTGGSIEDIARRRRTDPRHLTRELRGDLDWIIMKALEKDRTRRYCTANELAQDIERHLSDQPVSAGPPSAAYRMKKYYKRHRGQVAAAAAVALVFLLGLAGTSMGMVEARKRAQEAQEQREIAEAAMLDVKQAMAATEQAMAETKKAMAATDEAMQEAKRQAAIAEAVNRFLNEELLASVAPDMVGRDVTVMQILDRAAGQVNTNFADQPLVMATLHHTIGKSYLALGRLQEAEPHLDRAVRIRLQELGDEDASTIAAQSSLASLYLHRGMYSEAEALYLSLLERARATLAAQDSTTFGIINNLAVAYMGLARFTEAEKLLQEALTAAERALGVDHNVTIKMIGSLSNLAEERGNLMEAERLLRETMVRQERSLGPNHVDVLLTRSNLAMIYHRQGRLQDAEQLQSQVLAGRRSQLGNDHPETFAAMTNLALILRSQSRHEEAGVLLEEAVEVGRRVLGPSHPYTHMAVGSLAQVYEQLGRPQEAETLLKEALDGIEALLGPVHPEAVGARADLMEFYRRAGRSTEVARLMGDYVRYLKMAAEDSDATPHTLNTAAYELVMIEPESLRDPKAAVRFARRACEMTNDSEPYFLDTLACALAAVGESEEAVKIQKRAISMTPQEDPGMPEMLAHLEQFEAAVRAKTEPTVGAAPATQPNGAQ